MEINFIQIGAHVGPSETDLLSKLLEEVRFDWKGIFIEPHPESFGKLKENYKDKKGYIFENIAISDKDGIAKLYYSKSKGDINSYANASLIPDSWKKRNTDVIDVPIKTLKSIGEKYNLVGKEFDLLILDTEGYDDKIIMSTNFSEICPKRIIFEKVFMLTETQVIVKKHLESFGYTQIEYPYKYKLGTSNGFGRQDDYVFDKL